MAVGRVLHFKEGQASMKQLLGGKGASLAEMTNAGLPVPPGFTITTEVCRNYYALNRQLPEGLMDEVWAALGAVEEAKQQRFGDERHPLLVSVRSGSVTSMPGMMDTILNLGLNDITVAALASQTSNARFAYDCYRRFIQMFGNVVFGVESLHFETLLEELKRSIGVHQDADISAEAWQTLIPRYQRLIEEHTGNPFPQNARVQLEMAIDAVFRSWNNPRANVYRKLYNIPEEQGTAVNIQSMVFGNMGSDCGTGVLFTRNPSTGEKVLYGEYLLNAQGEDVVSGARTPMPIRELQQQLPAIYDQLSEAAAQLEAHYADMQDIEFTVEQNKLYILQTRNGKRTAQAALKVAVDLVGEGIIAKEEALQRIEPGHLDQLLHRAIDTDGELDLIATGLPASPGAATGQAVFDADTAEEWGRAGKRVILVSTETTPEDIHGVIAAEGILTSRGGMTSHAAVVARGMGKPCVCGCEEIRVSVADKMFLLASSLYDVAEAAVIREGDWLTLDGATGKVIRGTVALKEPEITPELQQILAWADDIRKLNIYTNADTPEDAQKARELGAEGIGLCRTEHMFLSPERLPVVRRMILAETEEERKEALDLLLPMQRQDFVGLFAAMDGLPVNIRLLDPPLHEFLPNLEQLLVQQREAGPEERPEIDKLIRKVRNLHEMNPMLGQRGCRLGIVLPDIYDMQAQAIFEAIGESVAAGIRVHPEIMIPLVGHANELQLLRARVERIASEVLGDRQDAVAYKVGTMIEVPRAALTAGQIAAHADYFSFGTNDLTQMAFGYSRDDAEGKFLTHYVEQQILPHNPFQELDQEGVGQLIELALERGRAVKPGLKAGVCGEHGGDRSSILYCHSIGLDYVSCSPYRVPMARVAAAQAQILHR